jgi:adenylate cyclase
MFTLVYTLDGQTRRYPVPAGGVVVGRAAHCDLVIEDPSISRRHAQFSIVSDRCYVRDLHSRNGTFVNDTQVTESPLKAGDTVILGRFPLQLERPVTPQPVALTDDHSIIESPGTVYRRLDPVGIAAASSRPSVEPERLLSLMTGIAQRLVRWQSVEEILERVIEVTFDTVPVERAFLLMIEPEGTPEVRVARSRVGARIEGATLSRTVVRRVIDERLAMLANDARLDPRLAEAQSLVMAQIRSFICVPLWSQTSVIGALYVDNPNTSQLTAADLDVLQALASYAAVAIEQGRLTARVLHETQQRERLARYHSGAVVDRILASSGGTDEAFLAEERDVTVLFADIVGFTSRTEYMRPPEVAVMLNNCFGVMCDAVFEQEGTLDKFIGDAVMAVFGAPLEQADHATRALRAAKAMRQAVAALDISPPIVLRQAINSGPATVGDIGSPRRREYTILGDVVNTCSRLESSVCLPGQIVLTRATKERLSEEVALRPVGRHSVRGREEEIDVYELPPEES